MKLHIPNFVFLSAIILVTGCKREISQPKTVSDAQHISEQTTWYFAEPIANPVEFMTNYSDVSGRSSQKMFMSPSQTRILYDEFTPSRGFKSFHGFGPLSVISNLNYPIFEGGRYYGQGKNSAYVIGFAGGRMFKVEAESFTAKPKTSDECLVEAVTVATNAFSRLEAISKSRK